MNLRIFYRLYDKVKSMKVIIYFYIFLIDYINEDMLLFIIFTYLSLFNLIKQSIYFDISSIFILGYRAERS